jgi:hypothetical protein
MKLFYYIRRFWEIPGVERRLIIMILFVNLLIKCLIKFLPLRFYFFYINKSPLKLVHNYNADYNLKLILKVFRRLYRHKFISDNCLEKSLILRFLLNLYKIPNQLKFSIINSQNFHLKAHSYIVLHNDLSFFKDLRFNDLVSV